MKLEKRAAPNKVYKEKVGYPSKNGMSIVLRRSSGTRA
jgi:hypothetical protein